VELFGTSWCPWCKKAREYFRARGIEVVEYDTEKDEAAVKRKLGANGGKHIPVPTVIIGGTVIQGYSPERYEVALAQP